jgi:tRNA pseudouridine38-40 synthase
MKRFFLHLSYDGTRYRGWQRQVGVLSIQEVIETAISKIFKEEITVYGCGRTDALVHASQYFAHFETQQTLDFDLLFRLNKVLPDDISIHDIIPVSATDHARFHATERSYQYFFHTKKMAHLSNRSTLYTAEKLDYTRMKSAIDLLPNYTDFMAFCKTPDAHPSTLCQIKSVAFSQNADGTQFCFEITANRFLRGMIRNIMARVIMVGNGEMSLEEFEKVLKNEHSDDQLPIAAPPQGLYLSRIVYPFLETEPVFDPKSAILMKKGDTWRV